MTKTDATANDFTLATGSLTFGQNDVALVNGVPSAAVTTTFNQAAGEGGFFVSPPASVVLDLFGSFTNNLTEVTCFTNVVGGCGALGPCSTWASMVARLTLAVAALISRQFQFLSRPRSQCSARRWSGSVGWVGGAGSSRSGKPDPHIAAPE